MPQIDINRLVGLDATTYIQKVDGVQRITQTWESIKPIVVANLSNILSNADQGSPKTLSMIKDTFALPVSSIAPDAAAAKWFIETAHKEKSNGNFDAAIDNYTASIAAMPAADNDSAAHTGAALAIYEQNKNAQFDVPALMSIVVSPYTTNSWLVVGLYLASQSKGEFDPNLAKGAFKLAIHFSKNATFTKKYFLDLAGKSSHNQVVESLRQAVQEMDSNPNTFSQ